MRISTVPDLERALAEPSAALVADMARLEGDLLLLGAGGKMGPTLAMLARNALAAADNPAEVVAVSRYSDASVRRRLEDAGVRTVAADLMADGALDGLPDAPNVVYMPAMKFGSTWQEAATWAINTYLGGRAAERYRGSRIVAFSSGNVYPLTPVQGGGAREEDPTGPVGEYAQSVLGRERLFQYFSETNGTKVALIRLNYAVELRYGVLVDIALAVKNGDPIDLSMGNFNVIWQGDANEAVLRSLLLASSPARVINVTGPETVSVRRVANAFGEAFGREPDLVGSEEATALLNDASAMHQLLGYPRVSLRELVGLIADWVKAGGETHGKPTKFQVRSGKF